MLWFNFVLGSNFFFFCFGYGNLMIMSLKQKKKKFEPRIKLNHNIYIAIMFIDQITTKSGKAARIESRLITFRLFIYKQNSRLFKYT